MVGWLTGLVELDKLFVKFIEVLRAKNSQDGPEKEQGRQALPDIERYNN